MTTSAAAAPYLALAAGFLMVLAGTVEKRLRWRTVECRVCHRPRTACTCRWL